MAHELQIDMLRIEGNVAVCSLYTGERCVRIIMSQNDYLALKRDGFFIRPGDKEDSAGVLNTTDTYVLKSVAAE